MKNIEKVRQISDVSLISHGFFIFFIWISIIFLSISYDFLLISFIFRLSALHLLIASLALTSQPRVAPVPEDPLSDETPRRRK